MPSYHYHFVDGYSNLCYWKSMHNQHVLDHSFWNTYLTCRMILNLIKRVETPLMVLNNNQGVQVSFFLIMRCLAFLLVLLSGFSDRHLVIRASIQIWCGGKTTTTYWDGIDRDNLINSRCRSFISLNHRGKKPQVRWCW